LLGVGWMGDVHSTSFRRVPYHFPDCPLEARLVIAADEDPKRASRAERQLGYREWTTDWRAVIDHPEVDAICIALPNDLHLEAVELAAAAGKHVRAEKPLGRNPAETARAARLLAASNVASIVGLNYRHAPAVRHARDLIQSGVLGEINHFRIQFLAGYAADPAGAFAWRYNRERAGLGIVSDLGSHAIDLAHFLVGGIASVSATRRTIVEHRPELASGASQFDVGTSDSPLRAVETEDWVASLLRFESGVEGTLEASRVMLGAEARYACEVNGTRGAVSWNFERMNELEIYAETATGDLGYARTFAGPDYPDFGRFQPGRGTSMGYDDLKVIEAAEFLNGVAHGRECEPGPTAIMRVAEVIDAMVRSFESDRWESIRAL
jgi:predicted dehydrogenase